MSFKIFSNLKKFSNNVALINDRGKKISYLDIIKYEEELEKNIEGKSLILFFCKNCLEALIGYVSFIRRGHKLLLVDSQIKKNDLDNILLKDNTFVSFDNLRTQIHSLAQQYVRQ